MKVAVLSGSGSRAERISIFLLGRQILREFENSSLEVYDITSVVDVYTLTTN